MRPCPTMVLFQWFEARNLWNLLFKVSPGIIMQVLACREVCKQWAYTTRPDRAATFNPERRQLYSAGLTYHSSTRVSLCAVYTLDVTVLWFLVAENVQVLGVCCPIRTIIRQPRGLVWLLFIWLWSISWKCSFGREYC